MIKTGLIVSRNKLPAVIDELQKHGQFEVSKVNDSEHEVALLPKELENVEVKIADLEFCIRLLEPFKPAPDTFRQKLLGTQIESTEEAAMNAAGQDFSEVIEKCQQIEEEENRLDTELSRFKETRLALDVWQDFSLALDFASETPAVRFFIGSVDTKEYVDFEHKIKNVELTELKKITTSLQKTNFFLIVHRKALTIAEEILEEFRYSEMDFGDARGTVAEELKELENKISKLQFRKEALAADKRLLSRNHQQMMKLAYDGLLWQREKKEALQHAVGTNSTVILNGWMPHTSFYDVREKLETITPNIHMFDIESSQEEEQPPVMFSNSSLVKPFQNVTGLYGTPVYQEIDPTPYLAPFFFIFFGFCLTDFGYGALMAITILLALKYVPLTKDMREMMRLLLFGAFSTMILGVLFGGYFGLTPDQLPFFKNPETGLFYGQMFDPINELVTKVMPLAYGMGVLQLSLGVVLNAINHWRSGDKTTAIFGSGSLLMILLTGILWFFFPAAAPWAYVLGFFTLTLVIGLMPRSGNIVGRVLLGLLGVVNEAISWLSNVLSYSRLFALGVATGVIALAFNSIATTIGGLMPLVLGIPVMVIIILFGHSLNMGLNILGAFVHSARLQFVEFFGMFFEGGGKEFKPLTRKKQYLFVSE